MQNDTATMKALAERLRNTPEMYQGEHGDWVSNDRAMSAAMREAATALDTAAAEIERLRGGVEVKALEWRRGRGWPATAETPFGSYKVWAGKDVWFRDEMLNGKHAKSEDEARQWAQADYAARIRSAIQGGENAE
jgi:hypothetical protein